MLFTLGTREDFDYKGIHEESFTGQLLYEDHADMAKIHRA